MAKGDNQSNFPNQTTTKIVDIKQIRLFLLVNKNSEFQHEIQLVRVYIKNKTYDTIKKVGTFIYIFSILLFITCVYYLGRILSPIITKKPQKRNKQM